MPSTGADYSLQPSSQPMGTQVQAGGVVNCQGAGSGRVTGGVTYWMPVVNVPYANTMGQVNLGWPPSQDVGGKDLPFSDINTLRYFFNLGVEYFGISANIQKQQQQQQQINYTTTPPPPPPHLLQGGPPGSSTLASSYPDPKLSSAVTPPPSCQASGIVSAAQTPPIKPAPSLPSAKVTHRNIASTSSSCPDTERKESMEMSSDVSDSGFTSSGEGEQGVEDDLDDQVDQLSKPSDDDASCGQNGEVKTLKGKGKRKYYMYGNLKLIKPIKDIPPRFQQLLTDAMAARARCEGQPIYMQEPSTELISVNQESGNSLNADAQCFYPNHQYNAGVVEGSGYTSFASTTMVSTSCPPPIMVPPPSFVPNPGDVQSPGLAATRPVSSCLASPLPPPQPGYGLGPNNGGNDPEGKVVTIGNAEGCMKSVANAGPGTRPAESAVCLASNAGDASRPIGMPGPPLVSSCPQPLTAKPANQMPCLTPPATLPASGSKPASSMGGEKPVYYLYHSQSSGFSTTLPQGVSHTPSHPNTLSQGQVVYVLNPPNYAAQLSCVNYPPPMIGPSGNATGLPCSPLAVQ